MHKIDRHLRARSPLRRRAAVLAGLALLGYGQLGHAGIVGSKHDFSASGRGGGEVCVFCHTPHNAMTTVTGSPLWNHQLSATTYTLYSSPTRTEAPEQPRTPSKLCLSCHDGTIAIGSFGGHTGNQFVVGAANLGTDLSNDHPISVRFRHQTLAVSAALNCIGCHYTIVGLPRPADDLPFYGGYVECATCHEPHSQGPAPKMLRKTMGQSTLCVHCH